MDTLTRREWLSWAGCGALGMAVGCSHSARAYGSSGGAGGAQNPLIGYTRYRCDLPGGRRANCATMRAWVVRADGRDARALAEDLADNAETSTQFAGWSPEGGTAIVGRCWESAENAAWEEEHKTFRFIEGQALYDSYLVDIRTGRAFNVTEVERVSHYNAGLFFIPGTPERLGFTAMIGENSHPFVMDLDGRNKRDVSGEKEGFAYGFSVSPDASRITYHKDYQVYIAQADGADAVKIETGNAFNFGPQWSPDGQWVMFVSGERENCDPYVVRADGSGLRRVASRNGYKGWIAILDVFDFHEGSSDVPIWANDSRGIYYTALFGANVELMWASLDGEVRQLTRGTEGALHYHPKLSPDGRWMAFGSTQSGRRQLYVRSADPREEEAVTHAITDVDEGWAAMWPHWQPASTQAS